MAASATLALKADVWFRRGLLLIVSPVRGYHRRYQAETPLIGLFKFASPALTLNAPEAGDGCSALATSGPRLPGAGTGGGASAGAVPLTMALRPLNPACAIFRSTRSSAAVQGSRAALPAGSSPLRRNARCWSRS